MGVWGPDFANVAYHEGLIHPTFLLHTHFHTRRIGISLSGRFPLKIITGGQHISSCCDREMVKCLIASSSDEDTFCSDFINGMARNHIKIGRSFIHVTDELFIKVFAAPKAVEILMECCDCVPPSWLVAFELGRSSF